MAGTSSSGGRNALSPALHAIRGTVRADRHDGYDVPEPPPGAPEQPRELEGLAAEEWGRMVTRLETTGAVSRVDDMAVYQYCRAFAEVEALSEKQAEVEQSIDRLEDSVSDVEKADRMALFLEIGKMRQLAAGYDNKIRSGRESIRKWLVEFGLTPAARTRVKLPPKKQESKLDKFRRGA